MRLFYVLYVPDLEWQSHLDLMRLLCNPDTETPAHLTVRGPYRDGPDKGSSWQKEENIEISVVGVDAFFTNNQNTIFFKCESSRLANIFWKPDFKNGVPHITIYDGKSSLVALDVLKILKKYQWNFSFVADRLHELRPSYGQRKIEFTSENYAPILEQCIGSRLSRKDLMETSWDIRMNFFEAVVRRFKELTSESIRKVERNDPLTKLVKGSLA